MVTRRFAQVSTSDEEEEEEAPPTRRRTRSSIMGEAGKQRKRKKMKLLQEEEEEEDEEEPKGRTEAKRGRKARRGSVTEVDEEEKNVEKNQAKEEEKPEDAKPIGELVKTSGKGRGKKDHYKAFEYDGNQYELEDPVLLTPEDNTQKPYVAIIKDITQSKDGQIMVLGQWFYRPEEALRKGGGSWQSRDTRELFYSFHHDEVPAESVMHKCVVHFVPIHKQLPNRKEHPGFIVQKVYDTVERKLWKLTDKDYEDSKQDEIDVLVNKTMARLGDLPDIETEETMATELEDQTKAKRTLRKRNLSPVDVRREDEPSTRPDPNSKAETPGSCPSISSEYRSILELFDVLTGDHHRDKCLERLLQAVHYVCSGNEVGGKKVGLDGNPPGIDEKTSGSVNEAEDTTSKGEEHFIWPDAAVPAVITLEKTSHDTLASDFQKYNQKIRQLVFNLKNNPLLARRLLNGELRPTKILTMSPTELKEGLTAEETSKKEPDELERMQMTDARCSRCSEFKVGLRDIIQAGHGDRYQLECVACGHSWYASRDEASTLTIDGPSTAHSVGASATARFESVEKKLASPSEAVKAANEVCKPGLQNQKSFGKTRITESTKSDE